MRTIVLAALLSLIVAPALAQQRSGPGPCRQGVLALIGMLDDKDDRSAGYRHAYEAVAQTCGPVSKARDVPVGNRAACADLARAMLDVIEGGKITSPAFVRARDQFAATCPPR
jgi:hypothetical protein